MGVYLEPVRKTDDRGRRSKLRADSVDELHQFVETAGLARATFVPNPTVEDLGYYDLGGRERRRAVKAGADDLDWTDAYRRISDQMVAGTRTVTRRRGRFGVTQRVATPTPAHDTTTIDLREPAATHTGRGRRQRV